MNLNSAPSIAVIGGGFCGSVTLIQLIKQATKPLNIILINCENPNGKGIAFSSYNSRHVLNVPAAKMSAFPDEPEHFINWVKSKQRYQEFVNDELNDRFLPRVVYGQYLEELFTKVVEDAPYYVNVKIISDEATDIIQNEEVSEIILKSGSSFKADIVVLALGNFLPDNPKIKDDGFYASKKYFRNPWLKKSIQGVKHENNILIIGTGLTMVDNVLSLIDEKYEGKIYAISTKGFFPLSHKKRKPYTDILEELHPPYSIPKLYNIFRKHIKYVLSHGITGEAVVDAIRPKTQEIWLSLTLKDKIRFMSHIRHLWGVARHRLPKEIYDQMQSMIADGKLEIIGGRLKVLKENGKFIDVVYQDKKFQEEKELKVDRVINCTGPATDLNRLESPLIKNLLRRGLISNDEMKLGINALPDGTIIHKDHSVSSNFFTIGSMLKGILWESTAVPELRTQAKSLAGLLLKKSEVKQKAEA
ncbi:MAG: FAD/NAD(P)-binding protein [bacterium]|nr:FAD/NAD(P)-binding protein [bacterium]